MRPKMKAITVLAVASMIMFMIANALTLLPTLSDSYRPLFNTLGFAALLYGWAILGIWRQRKFAMGFLNFINVVYTFGFISTLLSQTSWLTTIVSIAGLMIDGYWFWTCRQASHQLRSQNIS